MTKTNSTENQERCKIVRACLTHVPFDGWTQKSLELAANDYVRYYVNSAALYTSTATQRYSPVFSGFLVG